MKNISFLRYILFVCMLLSLEATPSRSSLNDSDCPDEVPSKIMIRHREHKGVGYDKGYTTVETFLTPNWTRNLQPYADIRGHIMNNGKLAANMGFGARGAPIKELVIGGNLFFDYLEVSKMPSYQLGMGLELFSSYIDFRLNGYLPIGQKNHTSKVRFDRFEMNNIILNQSIKASLGSVYAEFGGWIPKLSDNFRLYVAGGPYYLGLRHIKPTNSRSRKVGNKWGGKSRIAARIFEYFDAGIEFTYDPLFLTRAQGYLGISFPLGPARLYRGFKKRKKQDNGSSRQFRERMTQTVHRNEIIPVYKKDVSLTVSTEDGEALNFVFVNLTSQPHLRAISPELRDGTFEKPFLSLSEAKTVPSSGIVVFPPEESDDFEILGSKDLENQNDKVFVVNPPEGSTEEPIPFNGYITSRLRIYFNQLRKDLKSLQNYFQD